MADVFRPPDKILRPLGEPKEGAGVLVCFPYAGGSCDVYRDWPAYFGLTVVGVVYRGRFPDGLDDVRQMALPPAYGDAQRERERSAPESQPAKARVR